MEYREEESKKIPDIKVNYNVVEDSIFNSQYREDEIALQSKEQSANIKEKLERENVVSTKQYIRSD